MMEYPFGQLGSAIPAVSTPIPSLHPQPTLKGSRARSKGLEAVQELFRSSQNTGVLSALFCSPI